jgi:hypothetical protein
MLSEALFRFFFSNLQKEHLVFQSAIKKNMGIRYYTNDGFRIKFNVVVLLMF